MNRIVLLRVDRAGFVDGLADDVQDAAQGLAADRHHDLVAGVHRGLAANETIGAVHRDATNGVFTEVLRDFENEIPFVLADRRDS